MNSKSNKFKLIPKEYLFLVVCLFIFFVVGIYLMSYGTIPKGNELIITGIGIFIAIPIVIYMIKNI